MARYTGPNCKMCRREGCKLYLKGERCTNGKCAFDHRSTAPGQHGAARKKVGEYGKQLREKQKARRYYGVLEGQFHHYYEMAEKMEVSQVRTSLHFLRDALTTSYTEWVWQHPERKLVSLFFTATSLLTARR